VELFFSGVEHALLFSLFSRNLQRGRNRIKTNVFFETGIIILLHVFSLPETVLPQINGTNGKGKPCRGALKG